MISHRFILPISTTIIPYLICTCHISQLVTSSHPIYTVSTGAMALWLASSQSALFTDFILLISSPLFSDRTYAFQNSVACSSPSSHSVPIGAEFVIISSSSHRRFRRTSSPSHFDLSGPPPCTHIYYPPSTPRLIPPYHHHCHHHQPCSQSIPRDSPRSPCSFARQPVLIGDQVPQG